ncbi:exodeoxyribonuclease V alpha subunit [Mycoplasmopsis mustelae]|uniref:Exodeoxyribonuclease V alpha subunit n=1 Tax=Mycoplasmopsis mustelae TaxID=171289 RepID=A0A4R7UD53_9BACT|nr:AAA family ATPase [Mycoplasmopsis mustelae]TDV24398.1 exodeoxyribonuclease V alpha subunit [Mycoplasmopsis mustelae]
MTDIQLKNSDQKSIGKFTKILAGGEKQGWALFVFESSNKKERKIIYVRKNIPELFKKYEITYLESISRDNRRSFSLTSYIPVIEIVDVDIEIKQHIAKIPKIGIITVKKIYDQIGRKFFTLLDDVENNINLLKSILTETQIKSAINYYDLNKKTIKKITEAFLNESESYKKNIEFFYGNDLINLYTFLKTKFQSDLIDFIKKYKEIDPYQLYIKDGYNFDDIDRFALLLGYHLLSIQRIKAFIYNALTDLEDQNSTFIFEKDIIDLVLKKMTLLKEPENKDLIKKVLEKLIDENFLIKDHFMYCRLEIKQKEEFIVKKLNELKMNSIKELKPEKDDVLNYLSDEQKEGYFAFLNNNISIISGNPGTGKSSLIKHFYTTLRQNKYKIEQDFFILAPTGRAASNLSTKGHFTTRTIHSFLGIKDDKEKLQANEEVENAKILIIDEFSMVNINLFYKLLISCKNLEKLVLLGDKDQLPAIGPGYILNDLINSNQFKITILKKFYRSDSEEIKEYFDCINYIGNYKNVKYKQEIINYLSKLKIFNLKDLENNFNYKDLLYYENDWNNWIGLSKKQKHVNLVIYRNFEKDIISLFKIMLKKYGINDSIILCPMYRGLYGINKINLLIQSVYNPRGEIVYTNNFVEYKLNYRVGDKVIQLVNRYDNNISNGDIGYIQGSKVVAGKTIIDVLFKQANKEILVSYTKEDFVNEINLAYAITVHKFQGSETKAVIFVINHNYKHMLSRKLVYTAVSRAISELWIFSPVRDLYSKILIPQFREKKEIHTNMQKLLKG